MDDSALAVNPVGKLPPEVAGEIFRFCLPDTLPRTVEYLKTVYRLGRVSLAWWNVIKGYPSLWTYIDFDYPRTILTCISRSGVLPIHVNWSNSPANVLGTSGLSSEELMEIAATVEAQDDRWYSVLIVTSALEYLGRWMDQTLRMLVYLTVFQEGSGQEPSFTWELTTSLDISKIDHLFLINAQLPRISQQPNTITSLVLTYISTITPNETFMGFLNACRETLQKVKLDEMALSGIVDYDFWPTKNRVICPELSTIQIKGLKSTAIRMLMQAITAPKLWELNIEWAEQADDDGYSILETIFCPIDDGLPVRACLASNWTSEIPLIITDDLTLRIPQSDNYGLAVYLSFEESISDASLGVRTENLGVFKACNTEVALTIDLHEAHYKPSLPRPQETRLLPLLPTTTRLHIRAHHFMSVVSTLDYLSKPFATPSTASSSWPCPELYSFKFTDKGRFSMQWRDTPDVIAAVQHMLKARDEGHQGLHGADYLETVTVLDDIDAQFDEDVGRFVVPKKQTKAVGNWYPRRSIRNV